MGAVLPTSEPPVVSIDLACRLRAAGLRWDPAEGDRFVLLDRGLDDRVFTISEMVVEVHGAPAGRLIAFNGTTEWALDAVEEAEAVWLPREAQLREELGDRLLSLVRLDDGWGCTYRADGALEETTARRAADAYALALLRHLEPA